MDSPRSGGTSGSAHRGGAPPPPLQPLDDRILIGEIVAPHGIRGEVRVRPFSDFPERLRGGRQVLLGAADAAVEVRWQGSHRGLVIARLQGCMTREAAERLRGVQVYVNKRDLPALPQGEYYFFELIGLAVVDEETGQTVGRVVAVEHSPANDLYWVETPAGLRHAIPAVKAIVRSVEPDQGRIVIRPIPGLLE